jgi:hypothetical protein
MRLVTSRASALVILLLGFAASTWISVSSFASTQSDSNGERPELVFLLQLLLSRGRWKSYGMGVFSSC